MPRVAGIALILVALLAPAAGRTGGNGGAELGLRAPLLRYKLELARQNRAYLHLLPEVVIVYFHGIEMKRIPVQRQWRLHERLLARGRVLSWTPELRDPILLASENRPVDTLVFLDSLVTIDKVPPTFSVALEDGTLIRVTASETGGFQPQRRSVSLVEIEPPPPDVILLWMTSEAARQFYWLLEDELLVIF